jgi:hypothetical protein
VALADCYLLLLGPLPPTSFCTILLGIALFGVFGTTVTGGNGMGLFTCTPVCFCTRFGVLLTFWFLRGCFEVG